MTTETTYAAFGWCLTSQHHHCRGKFTTHGRLVRCSCPCHKEPK